MSPCVEQEPWFLVVAMSDPLTVRVLLRSPAGTLGFARWLSASGWRVRVERTLARNPYELGRTREEDELALELTTAYDRWAKVALTK